MLILTSNGQIRRKQTSSREESIVIEYVIYYLDFVELVGEFFLWYMKIVYEY